MNTLIIEPNNNSMIHVCRELLNNGNNVFVLYIDEKNNLFDNLNHDNFSILEWKCHYISKHFYFNSKDLGRMLSIYNIDSIILDDFNNSDNSDSLMESLIDIKIILDAVKNNYKLIKKLLLISSYDVYGVGDNIQNETSPMNNSTSYISLKNARDNLAMSYHYEYNLPITILRPSELFGENIEKSIINDICINMLNNDALVLINNKVGAVYIKDFVKVVSSFLKHNSFNGIININGDIINLNTIIKYIKDEHNNNYNLNKICRLSFTDRYSDNTFKCNYYGDFYYYIDNTIQWMLENEKN